MDKGKIIFLNGVSCSGKTTLAKTLQERLTEPFYSLSLDTFINSAPEKYFSAPDGRKIVNRAVSVLPHTIKIFSDMGLNVVADHVFLNMDGLMEECVEALHEYPVLFVHVTCPPEELRRREGQRGVAVGTAERQLTMLVPRDTYDLTVDTTDESSVNKIIEALRRPEDFTAFKALWAAKIF